MKNHKPGCPRLQFWDGGEDVPCLCDSLPKRKPLIVPRSVFKHALDYAKKHAYKPSQEVLDEVEKEVL